MHLNRFYLRSPVTGITIEKQELMMREAGFTGDGIYKDDISSARMKKRTPSERYALLVQRADMLRPTSRKAGEVIGVASLRVLALDPVDLMQCFAAAFERGATIHALDTGLSYHGELPSVEEATRLMADAVTNLRKAQKQAQTSAGQPAAVKARIEKAQKSHAKIRKAALPHWIDDKLSIQEIAKLPEVDTKVSTLNRVMGPREEARKKHKKKGEML